MRGDDLDIDDAETLDGADPKDADDAANDSPLDDGRMKKVPKRDDRANPRERRRTTVPQVRSRES